MALTPQVCAAYQGGLPFQACLFSDNCPSGYICTGAEEANCGWCTHPEGLDPYDTGCDEQYNPCKTMCDAKSGSCVPLPPFYYGPPPSPPAPAPAPTPAPTPAPPSPPNTHNKCSDYSRPRGVVPTPIGQCNDLPHSSPSHPRYACVPLLGEREWECNVPVSGKCPSAHKCEWDGLQPWSANS